MGLNQRIEKSVYAPDRNYRAQLYGPLLAANAENFTPDFTGAIIGQNIADTANNLSKNMLALAAHYKEQEDKTQLRADNNAMNMAEVFFRNQQSAFAPQLDPEKGKLAVDRAVSDFKGYSAKLEGLSPLGKQRLEEMTKSVAESFNLRQRYGRMKLVEQQSETIHKTNLEQAVKSGNPEMVSKWYEACKEKNYRVDQTEKELLSRSAFFKLRNNIQNSPVSELKAVDELLQDVDKKGSSKVYKGMDVDDVRRARREISGLIAQKQEDNYNELIKDMNNGKNYSIEDIEELYKQDKIPLQVLQGFRKSYDSSRKKVNTAKKNDLEFSIYKASRIVDPIQRKIYFNDLKGKVWQSGLDIPDKLDLCKDIDQLRDAENKPGGDKVANNLIYATQQLKEKLYDRLKVYEKKYWLGADWLWKDEFYKNRTEAVRKSELEAAKNWTKENPNLTTQEIDEYIDNRVKTIKKEYGEYLTLKGFDRYFSGVNQKTISETMNNEKVEILPDKDGRPSKFVNGKFKGYK